MKVRVRSFQSLVLFLVVLHVLSIPDAGSWPHTTYIDGYANKYPGAPQETPSTKLKYTSTYVPEPLASPTPITYISLPEHGGGSIPLVHTGDTLLCSEVISGNVIKLSQGDTVTLIGVDLPTQPQFNQPESNLIKSALAYTSSTLAGKRILLEFENGVRDQYNRLLAYVILTDGTCANEKIISAGYGVAHKQFPYKLQKRYAYLENEARRTRRGLWGEMK